MRRTLGILTLVAAAALTAACGGGSTQTGVMPQASASAMAAGPTMPTDAAMASDPTMSSDAAMASESPSAEAMDAAPAAAGAKTVPQVTAMEPDTGNDGDMAKLPQGMSEAKAKAAGMGKDMAPVITITATETSCVPDKATVEPGKVWFKIVNKGMKINELYLESSKGKELVEVEKIRPDQAGAFAKKVAKGKYLIACEPGMADKQIRTPLTVTGGM